MNFNRAFCFYGYGLLEAWVFESFIIAPNASSSSSFIFAIGALGVAVTLFVAGSISNRIERISAYPALGTYAMIGATLCSIFIQLTHGTPQILFVLATSIPNAYLYLAWGEVYSRLSVEDAESISLGSAFVVVVAVALLTYTPNHPKTFIVALLPMASYIAYRSCMANLKGTEPEHIDPKNAFDSRTRAAIILGAGVPSAITFLFIGITSLQSAPNEIWSIVPAGLIVFVAIFLLFIHHTPAFAAKTLFVAMGSISITICLSCGLALPSTITCSLTIALWLSQDMLCWLLFTRMYRDGFADCIKTYAFGQTIMLASTALGLFAAHIALRVSPSLNLTSLCLIVSALLFMTMIALSQLTPVEYAIKQPSNRPDQQLLNREALLAKLAQEYGLTKREGEIFTMLVNGRSAPFIRDKLYISESTVRSHIKHIHAKLGVTTKQETISFAESWITNELENDGPEAKSEPS